MAAHSMIVIEGARRKGVPFVWPPPLSGQEGLIRSKTQSSSRLFTSSIRTHRSWIPPNKQRHLDPLACTFLRCVRFYHITRCSIHADGALHPTASQNPPMLRASIVSDAGIVCPLLPIADSAKRRVHCALSWLAFQPTRQA